MAGASPVFPNLADTLPRVCLDINQNFPFTLFFVGFFGHTKLCQAFWRSKNCILHTLINIYKIKEKKSITAFNVTITPLSMTAFLDYGLKFEFLCL